MGIFDSILGKKSGNEQLQIEPAAGGYSIRPLKETGTSKVNRVDVMLNAAKPLYDEPELIKDVLTDAGIVNTLAPGVFITTSYEAVPGIKEFMDTQKMPEDLNAFVMARAMMKGIALGPTEMGKIQVNPFQINDTMGVLILKEI